MAESKLKKMKRNYNGGNVIRFLLPGLAKSPDYRHVDRL